MNIIATKVQNQHRYFTFISMSTFVNYALIMFWIMTWKRSWYISFFVKFGHSEKATKVWNNLPLNLTFTKATVIHQPPKSNEDYQERGVQIYHVTTFNTRSWGYTIYIDAWVKCRLFFWISRFVCVSRNRVTSSILTKIKSSAQLSQQYVICMYSKFKNLSPVDSSGMTFQLKIEKNNQNQLSSFNLKPHFGGILWDIFGFTKYALE